MLTKGDMGTVTACTATNRQTFEEIRLQIDFEKIPTQALDGVVEGKDMNAFPIFDVHTLVDINEIAEFDSEIVPGDLVHLDAAFLHIVRGQADEDGISPLLSTEWGIRKLCTFEWGRRKKLYRTMIVSPRKSARSSIVVGLSVATMIGKIRNYAREIGLGLTRVVIGRGLVYDKSIWTGKIREMKSGRTLHCEAYDFLGLRIAVEISLGPGWGGAPLGSAIAEQERGKAAVLL
jgi:hypothetical protein